MVPFESLGGTVSYSPSISHFGDIQLQRILSIK